MVNIILWLANRAPNPRLVKRARRDRALIAGLYITGIVLIVVTTPGAFTAFLAPGATAGPAGSVVLLGFPATAMMVLTLAMNVLMLAAIILYLSLVRAVRTYLIAIKAQQRENAPT